MNRSEHAVTLADILTEKTKAELLAAVKIWYVPCESRKTKATLIAALVEKMSTDGEVLSEVLLQMEEQTFRVFNRACEEGSQRIGIDGSYEADVIESWPFFSVGRTSENEIMVMVAEEIKSLYDKVYSSSFINARCRMDYLVRNINAAVNLYGVIDFGEFVGMFNAYNENFVLDEDCRELDEKELFNTVLYRQDAADSQFLMLPLYGRLRGHYLVSKEFHSDASESWEGARDDVEELIDARESKTRWCPSYDEFMKYADEWYYEETSATKGMLGYLEGVCKNELAARLGLDDLHFAIMRGERLQELLDRLEEAGAGPRDESELPRIGALLTELNNTTRLWSNYGHTPDEVVSPSVQAGMREHLEEAVRKIHRQEKIGRNAPCPCGSGKKYKHCCGLR